VSVSAVFVLGRDRCPRLYGILLYQFSNPVPANFPFPYPRMAIANFNCLAQDLSHRTTSSPSPRGPGRSQLGSHGSRSRILRGPYKLFDCRLVQHFTMTHGCVFSNLSKLKTVIFVVLFFNNPLNVSHRFPKLARQFLRVPNADYVIIIASHTAPRCLVASSIWTRLMVGC
jgi:hypothetical protein